MMRLKSNQSRAGGGERCREHGGRPSRRLALSVNDAGLTSETCSVAEGVEVLRLLLQTISLLVTPAIPLACRRRRSGLQAERERAVAIQIDRDDGQAIGARVVLMGNIKLIE